MTDERRLSRRAPVLVIENSVAVTGAFRALLQGLQALGFSNVTWVVPRNSQVAPILETYGYKVVQLPMVEIGRSLPRLLAYLPMLLINTIHLRALTRRINCSAIIVNDFYNLLGACLRLSGFRGLMLTYVRFLPARFPAALQRLWTWAATSASDWVVAVSDAVKAQLPESRRIVRVYDFAEKYEVAPPSQEERLRFTYVGNYTPGKGQDLALRALRLVKEREPKLYDSMSLDFAGSTFDLEKNRLYLEELKTLATQLAISDAVRFFGFQSSVGEFFRNSDAALNFSASESFSLTCLEASASALPVIASKSGGPQEIIEHRATGLLVETGDVDAMAAAMCELGHSADLRRRLGQAGRDRINTLFSKADYLAQMSSLCNLQCDIEGCTDE